MRLGIYNCIVYIISRILIPIPTYFVHIQIQVFLCQKSSMIVIFMMVSRFEIIYLIIMEIRLLLCKRFGSVNCKYLSCSIISLILLINTIIFRILLIKQSLDIKKAKSQKPDF